MPVAVEFSQVTKEFRRRDVTLNYGTLKTFLSGAAPPPEPPPFRALCDLSFTVRAGEALGIIGSNGAGKSTALKIAAGIYRPTRGSVRVRGAIGCLIELGLGFHSGFSGRENILISGMLNGLARRQVQARVASIIEFADLGEFIDQPVRTYSAGMYMRLGMSVAVHCDPEVLLIDEVMAVGDAAFAAKCVARIDALRARGGTILLASHDLSLIRAHCDRALWIDHGRPLEIGPSREVTHAYEGSIGAAR